MTTSLPPATVGAAPTGAMATVAVQARATGAAGAAVATRLGLSFYCADLRSPCYIHAFAEDRRRAERGMTMRTGSYAGSFRLVLKNSWLAGLVFAATLGAAPLTALAADGAAETAATPAAAPAQPATTKKRSSKRHAKASHKRTKSSARRHGRRHARVYYDVPSIGHTMGLQAERDSLALKSSVALVLDQESNEVLFEKNTHAVLPIASLTKLMTALVVSDAKQPMDEVLEISAADADYEKHVSSRLRPGTKLTREDAMLLALMASENRAASVLGRNYPGGLDAFIDAMNAKAKSLGMNDTHYVDPAGLSQHNVSSAIDLARLVSAAYQNPTIREFSTQTDYTVQVGRRKMQFHNTNALVRKASDDWQIGLQKTGFTNEAGRCLVMQAVVEGRNVVMVFLDSAGKLTRFADANRVRKWIEKTGFPETIKATTPALTQPVSEATVKIGERKM